jgi:hypothetical protein
MIQTREQEITATIQTIKNFYSPKKFEHKFITVIKNYLKNSDHINYFEMRNQIDLDFNLDMNPIFIYLINNISIINPDINPYIKIIDKIRLQYGTILHRVHEAAINPTVAEGSLGTRQLKPFIADDEIQNYSNIIRFPKGSKKRKMGTSAVHRVQTQSYLEKKFDTVKTM